ncbi:DUF6544 family protein [Actinosynnema sp. NPDC020468]|uniref:DUF6544 family protein n=1 Tax=Actinosynnema sp. NPDC020468 TaxID=3154488 RepID=UPI00340B49F3
MQHDDIATARRVTRADIADLPAPARRYLEFAGVVGRPRDVAFEATLMGWFRLRPERRWTTCHVEQRTDAATVTRDFRMRLALAHLIPVQATDTYRDGRGRMTARVLGLFPVADGEGPEFDSGELVALLDDALLLAPSMLLAMPVEWTAVDDDTFDVTLTDGGVSVTGRVTVDARGAVRDFTSRDRWASLPEGVVATPWSTPVDGWILVRGRLRPRRATAVWHLPDGPFTYAQFDFAKAEITFHAEA